MADKTKVIYIDPYGGDGLGSGAKEVEVPMPVRFCGPGLEGTFDVQVDDNGDLIISISGTRVQLAVLPRFDNTVALRIVKR